MKGKKKYQIIENELVEDNFISRSQKKRDSSDLKKIGEQLVKLKAPKLEAIGISEAIRDAIFEFTRLNDYEAKRRQMQFIGKLIREDEHFNAEEVTLLLKDMNYIS